MLDPQLTKKKTLLSKPKYSHHVNHLLRACKVTEEKLLALDVKQLKVMLHRSYSVVELTENDKPFSFSDLCQLDTDTLNEMLDNASKISRMLRKTAISVFDFLKISSERRALLLNHAHQIDYLLTYCEVSFKDVLALDTFLLDILLQNAQSVSTLVCNTPLTVSGLMEFDLDRLRVFLNVASSIRKLHCNASVSLSDLELLAPVQLAAHHGNLEQLREVINLTKEAIECLERNSELTGNVEKRDIGFFGWLPTEMRAEALVFSRVSELITPHDAKEIVLQNMRPS